MSCIRLSLFVACAFLCLLHSSFADEVLASRADSAGPHQVQEALKAEAEGVYAAREQKSQDVLRSDPDSKEANWLTGKLERDGRWIDFNVLPEKLADEAVLREYRERRDSTPITAQSQLELANWCKKHHLVDRERAHLVAALELSPKGQDAAISARLGLKLIGGAWMSEKEIRAERTEQAAAQRNLKKWGPVIQRLAEKLDGRNEKVRSQAERELEVLQNPAVLPALEAVLARENLDSARLLVDLLGAFKSVQAAAPLSRLAVLSEWVDVRKSAAQKLRERPVGSYAPELLASMRTPIDSKVNLLVGADGVHLTQELTSETQSSVQHFERRFSTVFAADPRGLSFNQRESGSRQVAAERTFERQARAVEAAEAAAEREQVEAEFEVEQANSDITRWNTRVCNALVAATGLDLPAKPEPWWEWWREYNQLSDVSKGHEYRYTYEETYVPDPTPQTECLVAGTPVWTDRGMVPVESVKVGDLVLSKQPKTGELACQPVLRTTVREPEPVMKITTEHGEIRATYGHNFWVSGHGWTRVREIKAGDRLHGARRPDTVVSVTVDGKEKTYNLVVADFHTYFVGTELVLSHDLTFARPIDATVPGMKVE